MRNDDFEWGDAKAAANRAEHGVTFNMACDVFDDPFAVSQIDDRHDHGEDRYSMIGTAENRLLFVAYTQREHRIHHLRPRSRTP